MLLHSYVWVNAVPCGPQVVNDTAHCQLGVLYLLAADVREIPRRWQFRTNESHISCLNCIWFSDCFRNGRFRKVFTLLCELHKRNSNVCAPYAAPRITTYDCWIVLCFLQYSTYLTAWIVHERCISGWLLRRTGDFCFIAFLVRIFIFISSLG